MDQLHLAIQLDAFVPSVVPSTTSERRPAWPAIAAGTLSLTWIIPQTGRSYQQIVHCAPLALRTEDYSRGSIVSLRYKYVLTDLPLQLAKARLLHTLMNLQQEGWAMTPVIGAVHHNTLVDSDHVQTHLCWAIQVQYLSGRTVPMPKAGTYSAIVLTEIINRRTQIAVQAPEMAR
jgi:hypothetical protein